MSKDTIEITKVGLAVIKDRKMLMVRSLKHGDAFSTLGGKFEEGEDDMACLKREVKEEAGTEVIPDSLEFWEYLGAQFWVARIRLLTSDFIRAN